MAEKGNSKKSRKPKTSAGLHSGARSVTHQSYRLETYKDQTTGQERRRRVPGPNRKGLSDLDVMLMHGRRSTAVKLAGKRGTLKSSK